MIRWLSSHLGLSVLLMTTLAQVPGDVAAGMEPNACAEDAGDCLLVSRLSLSIHCYSEQWRVKPNCLLVVRPLCVYLYASDDSVATSGP